MKGIHKIIELSIPFIIKHINMKKIILISILLLTFDFISKAQPIRYFEFSTMCNAHGNWQDSTFIASTSDQVVIDTVLANISRPLNQRNFISGIIDHGHGGCNHNASHWFLWHFVPNQWALTQIAMEVCDGCPYSDVDADTAFWIGNLGRFCPWTGRPAREVSITSGITENSFENEIIIYPNPIVNKLNIKFSDANINSATIYDLTGQEISNILLSKQNETIDVTELENRLYFLKITNGNKTLIKKIIVNGK